MNPSCGDVLNPGLGRLSSGSPVHGGGRTGCCTCALKATRSAAVVVIDVEARKSNGTASREWVHARVKEVHALRNRISHHEPLVNGFPLPGQMDENQTPLRLTAEQGHEACMRLARMLDIHLADWLATNSRVPALLRIRPDPQGCAQQPDCVTRP